jgi:thiamine-phosphate pyrophosphorylase
MTQQKLQGLYVITDPVLITGDELHNAVLAAIKGGARIVQYRNKSSDIKARTEQASVLANLCKQQGVIFLVNDDVNLALQCAADGVHLGQTDTSVEQARKLLGPEAIIGVSCHGDIQLAEKAQAEGADYVAFGRFYPSHSKPHAPAADPEVLRQARGKLHIPSVAIGGITPDNGAALLTAGADMLAVIHGIFGQADIEHAAAQYSALFTNQ